MPATIMPRTISIPFEGEGSGSGELTWGQREMVRAVRLVGHWIPIGGVTPRLGTWSVDDLVDSVQFMMRRHQSLRTRLTRDAQGNLKQALSASGELVLAVYDVPPDEDPQAVAQAVSDEFSVADFDEERDWPIRVGAVCQDGVLEYAVFIYSHTIVDGMGIQALLEDLFARDPATGEAPPVTALQPLELAGRQSTAAARRQCGIALRHWESVARGVPDRESAAADPVDPPYRNLWFRSPAGLPAMQAVAACCGADTGPVLFAATAVALARTTGIGAVALLSVVNNRFRPGLADAVTQLAQRTPCLLETEGQTFEQVVTQAQRAILRAGMHGYLDPDECDRMLARVAEERGERVDLSCYYNDRRAPQSAPAPHPALPQEISSLLPQTTMRWGAEGPRQDNKFFLHINDSPDALDLLVSADSHYLGPAGLERFAREFEAVLVRAATEAPTPVPAAAPAEAAAQPPGREASVPDRSR